MKLLLEFEVEIEESVNEAEKNLIYTNYNLKKYIYKKFIKKGKYSHIIRFFSSFKDFFFYNALYSRMKNVERL